jgi:hypothetical protein
VRVVVRCSALRPVPVSLFPRSTHHTHTHTSSQSCAEKYPASVSPVSPTPLPALSCSPNDNGYTHLAQVVKAGLGL